MALSFTPVVTVPGGKLGVAIAWQRGSPWAEKSLDLLGNPIWQNWIYDHMSDPNYLPTAYSLNPATMQQYIDAAADQPGHLFLLGSEPNLVQTYIDPIKAAEFVRRWDTEIGGEYACCGTVQWAGWEAWLNAYLTAGGIVPTMWSLHIFDTYAYPPIAEFKVWMQNHDAVRPIMVTETACPWCDVAGNQSLMDGWARLLGSGDVFTVIWYSDADWHHLWPTTDLMNWDATELTPLGLHWLSLQPGGANDPHATPTVEPTGLDEDEQPRRMWMPDVR